MLCPLTGEVDCSKRLSSKVCCLDVLDLVDGLMGVEVEGMLDGWNREGAVMGMFIRRFIACLADGPFTEVCRFSSLTLLIKKAKIFNIMFQIVIL